MKNTQAVFFTIFDKSQISCLQLPDSVQRFEKKVELMSPLADISLSTNNIPTTHTNRYELYLTLLVCHACDNHTPEEICAMSRHF